MKAAATRRPEPMASSVPQTTAAVGERVAPPCPYCGGPAAPTGLPWDRAWCCHACGRLHLEGAVSVDLDRRPALPPPSWWGGASREEALALGLGPDCPGSGIGVPGLTDEELRRQLAVAAARLEAGQGSPWLRRWTDLLLTEDQRRRRGGAA
jgi:hypothetical protein